MNELKIFNKLLTPNRKIKNKKFQNPPEFIIRFCDICECLTVICPRCGNNICNGTSGTLLNGNKCNMCMDVYAISNLISKKLDTAIEDLLFKTIQTTSKEYKADLFRCRHDMRLKTCRDTYNKIKQRKR